MNSSTPEPELNVEAEITDSMFDVLNCYEIDASEVQNGTTYIDSHEAQQIIKQLKPGILALIQQVSDQRVREYSTKLLAMQYDGNKYDREAEGEVLCVSSYDISQTLEDCLSHKEAK